MTAQNGNIRLLLKLVLAAAVVVAVVVVALQRFSDVAVVAPVKRDKAVNAVPGSVTVFADKGIQELKFDVSGRVEICEALDPGRPFKKGDVLIKLDTAELEREIAETKRNFESAQKRREIVLKSNQELTVAEKNLANYERLLKRGDVSEESVEGLRRGLQALKTKIDLEDFDNEKAKVDFASLMKTKETQLAKMSIVALEDGVVEGAMVRRGALISAGAPVALVSSNERVVTAKISEENFGSIKLGQKAKVRLLIYPGEAPFDAKVSKILPSADEATQRYTVYLDVAVDPKRLKHNSTGQVTITVDEHDDRPLVPRRAIFNGNNVFVMKDGRLELRQIDVGFVSLSTAEVNKGLAPGELVVVENIDQFRHGQRVRVAAAK
jgi:RND family efflux transporter MFP subunit